MPGKAGKATNSVCEAMVGYNSNRDYPMFLVGYERIQKGYQYHDKCVD